MTPLLPNGFIGRISCGLAVCLLGPSGEAQEAGRQSRIEQGPVVLTSSVDRTAARVADPVEWTLRLEAPTGSRVGWPALPETIGAWEVRVLEQRDDIPLPADKGRGRRVWIRKFFIETLKTGMQTLPTAEVQVEIPDPDAPGERQTLTLRSEPLSIAVESSLQADADPSQFRDIKDVVDVEPPPAVSTAWVNWLIGGGCVAGLAALIASFYWFGRRNPLPAVWARKELARLREMSVDSSAERQQCFAEVVGVVRQFLADHFHSEIASQTAEEWTAYAETNVLLDNELRSQVAHLLKQHDVSRFSHTGITAQQLDEAFGIAERVIGSATTAGAESPAEANVRDAVRMRSSA